MTADDEVPNTPIAAVREHLLQHPSSLKKIRSARRSMGSVQKTPNFSTATPIAMHSVRKTPKSIIKTPKSIEMADLEDMDQYDEATDADLSNQDIGCLDDFLRVAGLLSLNRMDMRPKPRDSSIGTAAYEAREWPPADTKEVLEAALVDSVEVDHYSQGCLEIVDITAEINPTIKRMTQWLDQNQPPIFKKLAEGNSEAVYQERARLQQLLECCRLETKNAWNQWRVKLSENIRDRLATNLDQVSADLKTMEGLTVTASRLVDQQCSINNEELIQLRAQITTNAHNIQLIESNISVKNQSIDDTKQKVRLSTFFFETA